MSVVVDHIVDLETLEGLLIVLLEEHSILLFSCTAWGTRQSPNIQRGVEEVQCPYCGSQHTAVIDTRLSEREENAVRRRRECLSCQERFTTYERPEPLQLMVIKRDGSRQPFERAKLNEGLAKACAKRPVLEEEIEYMVDEIEAELRERRRLEVSSERLGEMALVRLQGLDMISYLRFASVFHQYVDVEQFRSEALKLKECATSMGTASNRFIRRIVKSA